ncbi:MAG: GNAT family protein [Bacteroidia bacterium]|nr:GNAT family protein [Bacteroidia bacterium]
MHISLRPWSKEDLPELVRQANNANIARYMSDVFPHPYTLENGKAFMEFANSKHPASVFAIVVNDQPVGSIGLHMQADILRKNYEIGYWLGEEHWGKGIAAEATRQICEYGFANLDCVRIFARIFGNNAASQKVVQKAGFVLEATFEKTIFKNGEFLDELIYALRK